MSDKKCKIEGCKRSYQAKGYCFFHYKKWRHKELPHSRYKICSAEACRKPISQRGLCEDHYKAKVAVKEAEAAKAAPASILVAAEAPATA